MDEVTRVPDADGADGSVCIGCGLCCDGTLLSHLAVSDESDLGWPLRSLGVEILAAAEPPVFALPCPAVEDGRCTIHHLHRPHACVQFECRLSRAVLAGATSADDAKAIIAEAIGLRHRVAAGDAQRTDLESFLDTYFRVSI